MPPTILPFTGRNARLLAYRVTRMNDRTYVVEIQTERLT